MDMFQPGWEAKAREVLLGKAKPPGSLGRLEDLAVTLSGIQETLDVKTRPLHFTLFVADHGVANAGVTMWPQAVSAAVAGASLSGGSACAVLARNAQVAMEVIDVGLAGARLEPRAGFTDARIRDGSGDLSVESALSVTEFYDAIEAGSEAAMRAVKAGARVLIAGEAGIGNTTAAAAIIAYVCDLDPDVAAGPGAGATQATLRCKREAIDSALKRARGLPPHEAFAALGGLEIAAIAGFYMEGASRGLPLILDGCVCGAAALIAQRLDPGCNRLMIAATLSPEPAHGAALAALGLTPYIDWGLRLGEGTGALLLAPMLDAAAAILAEMADLNSFVR